MNRWNIVVALLFLLLSSTMGNGQQAEKIERELLRLQTSIERLTAFIALLPDFANSDLKSRVEANLAEARRKYRDVIELLQQRRPVQAKLALAQAYGYLRQIEILIQQHPVLKLKFQEQLDRKIQQAEEQFQGNRDDETLYLLNRAKFFRQRAFTLFRQGNTLAALEYYRLALHFAEQVLKFGRPGGSVSDAENLRKLYLDTKMLIERVQSLLENSAPDQAVRNLFQKTNDEMQEIRRLYDNQNFAGAKQKLMVVNRALYRIIDLVEKIPQNKTERLQMDLESLRFSLQALREKAIAANRPAINRIYQRAENLAGQIERQIEQGRFVPARRNLFLANQLVLRLYKLLEDHPARQPQEIETQIIRTRGELEKLQQEPADWAHSTALLHIIDDNLDNAQSAFARREYQPTLSYLKMANNLILQYHRFELRQPQQELSEASVGQDLQRLAILLERLQEEDRDSEFRMRYQNARALYQLAQQTCNSGEWYTCRELTKIAINLLTK